MNEIVTYNDSALEIMSVDDNTAAKLAKAEIDVQIATAKKYPRTISKVRTNLVGLATLDAEIAGSCVYALPRDGKTIEGPSARFAEILVSEWGNCRAASRIIDEGKEFITAQGIFHDLERNVAIAMNVQTRIVGKNGKRYGVDMIGTAGASAGSKAVRNAILKGIPQAYWMESFQAARKVVRGDFKTLANRRADALVMLQGFGAKPEDVFALLGVRGEDDIGLDHLVSLRGIVTAVRDEGASLEDMIAEAKTRAPAAPRSGPPPAAAKPPKAAAPKQEEEKHPEGDPARLAEKKTAAKPEPETPAHNGETGEVLDVEKLLSDIETQLAAATTRDQVLEVVESMTDGVELPREAQVYIESLSDKAIERILDAMPKAADNADEPENNIDAGDGDPVSDFPGDKLPDDLVDMAEVEKDLDAAKTLEDLGKVAEKYQGRNFGENGAKAGELYAAAEKRIKGATKKTRTPPAAGASKEEKKPIFLAVDDAISAMDKAGDQDALSGIWTEQVEPIEGKTNADEKKRLRDAFDRNTYRLRNG
ncbi:hypothetical protein [Microvirga sp. Mcv34]|uniref:hypothetical protein n=1 Tax=Microvirga sp. Mcv34 TaxID=2926016 RepID=UPI0021CACC65|nr:hypothetical protein [Microvirga sp. Mcv34]